MDNHAIVGPSVNSDSASLAHIFCESSIPGNLPNILIILAYEVAQFVFRIDEEWEFPVKKWKVNLVFLARKPFKNILY